jgi:hypothetical protein
VPKVRYFSINTCKLARWSSIPHNSRRVGWDSRGLYVSIRQHKSAYVSIRQHKDSTDQPTRRLGFARPSWGRAISNGHIYTSVLLYAALSYECMWRRLGFATSVWWRTMSTPVYDTISTGHIY